MRIALFLCLQVATAASFRPFSTKNFFGIAADTLRQCKPESISNAAVNYRGGNNVQVAKSVADLDVILKESDGKPVVIDFSAAWCMPCKMIGPVFEAYSKDAEFKEVTFVKVDVDDSADIATKYGIQSMPTFLFLKDGGMVTRFSGADASKLRETIRSVQKLR